MMPVPPRPSTAAPPRNRPELPHVGAIVGAIAGEVARPQAREVKTEHERRRPLSSGVTAARRDVDQ